MGVKNYQRDLPYSEWPEHQKERMRKSALKHYYNNKEAAAAKAKVWRLKNLDYIKQKQREDKRKRKLDAIWYLGGKCQVCGCLFHPACFEFHHKDPATKDRDPSKMLSLSKERLYVELDKCMLLCANCHRLEHHKYE